MGVMITKFEKKLQRKNMCKSLDENKLCFGNVAVSLNHKENDFDLEGVNVNHLEENDYTAPRARVCSFGNQSTQTSKLIPMNSNLSFQSKDSTNYQQFSDSASNRSHNESSVKNCKNTNDHRKCPNNKIAFKEYPAVNFTNRKFKRLTFGLFGSEKHACNNVKSVDDVINPSKTNFINASKDKAVDNNEGQMNNMGSCYYKRQDRELSIESKDMSEIDELLSENLFRQNVIPLSPRDIYCLEKSWKGVALKMNEAGLLLVTKLIELNPQYEKFFKTRNGLPVPKYLQLPTAAENFMYALDKCIEYLDNPKRFFVFIKNMGEFHIGIKNFKAEYFLDFSDPFLYSVKEILGERYTTHIEEIYIRIINYIIYKIIEAYENRARKENHLPL